jgi:hypothetical protein
MFRNPGRDLVPFDRGIPLRVRVYPLVPGAPRVLNNYQLGFVQRCFKLFSTLVSASNDPAGTHRFNRIGVDGTRVFYSSVQGEQRMRVFVPPIKKSEPQLHGIGVMVCARNGDLIEELTLTIAAEEEGEEDILLAQPLILTPTKDEDGVWKWAVHKVKYLAGGQAVWADESRREWFSVASIAQLGNGGVFLAPNLLRQGPFFFNEEWTPSSNDRIATAEGPDGALGPLVALSGRYVFRQNDAITALAVPDDLPPFIHTREGLGIESKPEHFLYHVSLTMAGATVRVNTPTKSEGLRGADASPFPFIGAEEEEEPDDFPNVYDLATPMPINVRTAVIPPKGDKIVVSGFQGDELDHLITLEFDGPEASFSQTRTGKQRNTFSLTTLEETQGSSSTSWSIRTTSDIPSLYSACEVDTADILAVRAHRTTSFSATASGETAGKITTENLNRPYLDAEGVVRLETYSDEKEFTYSWTANKYVQDLSATEEISGTTTGRYWRSGRIKGETYDFPVGLYVDKLVSLAYNYNVSGGSTTFTVAANVTATSTQQSLLYWDPILEVVLIYRVASKYTIAGSKSANTLSTALNLTSLAVPEPIRGEVVLSRFSGGESRVLWSQTTTTPAVSAHAQVPDRLGLTAYNDIKSPFEGPLILGLQFPTATIGDFVEKTQEEGRPVVTMLQCTNPISGAIFERPYLTPPGQWQDIEYSDLAQQETISSIEPQTEFMFGIYSGRAVANLPDPTLSTAGFPSASSFKVSYARDPVTDAMVMSVLLSDTGQTWMFAITKDKIRDLREILDVDQEIKPDPTYAYNNLVSI